MATNDHAPGTDLLSDIAELLQELDIDQTGPAAPMCPETRAAIFRFLEVDISSPSSATPSSSLGS